MCSGALTSGRWGSWGGYDPSALREWVSATSRITHTDPKAEWGAFTIALAARMASGQADLTGRQFLEALRSALGSEANEMIALIERVVDSVERGESTPAFAASLGLAGGVSGYVFHSVPVAIHAWLSHPGDFCAAIQAVIACGGDADSTAAMVGGIVGARVGVEGLPADWLNGLIDRPWSVSYLTQLGAQLHASLEAKRKTAPPPFAFWALPVRNLLFIAVVLFHGLRRLLPPY